MKRLALLAATLFALASLTNACTAVEPEKVDLGYLTEQLTLWQSSFANIHAVWELRSLPEGKAVETWTEFKPSSDSPPPFALDEWIWADHGLDRFESFAFHNKPGATQVRTIDVFNGPEQITFRADYRKSPDRPEEFKQLSVGDGSGVGKPVSLKSRTPLDGLYWPAGAMWLPEMLGRWNWKLEGIEDVLGNPCARIVATQAEVTDAQLVEILWLDLNHNCLVRRHKSPLVPKRRLGKDFIVDEFQLVDGQIWFPIRGRLQMYSNPSKSELEQTFQVTKVEFNQSLDLAKFRPPAPVMGTVVSDGHGNVYTHGNPTQNPPVSANKPLAGSVPSATPPTSSATVLSTTLIFLSIALVAAGCWFRVRNQENRK